MQLLPPRMPRYVSRQDLHTVREGASKGRRLLLNERCRKFSANDCEAAPECTRGFPIGWREGRHRQSATRQTSTSPPPDVHAATATSPTATEHHLLCGRLELGHRSGHFTCEHSAREHSKWSCTECEHAEWQWDCRCERGAEHSHRTHNRLPASTDSSIQTNDHSNSHFTPRPQRLALQVRPEGSHHALERALLCARSRKKRGKTHYKNYSHEHSTYAVEITPPFDTLVFSFKATCFKLFD